MESGNQRGTAEFKAFEKFVDAVAHFFRGFVGERYGKDVTRPDATLGDDIGNTMGDDARLPGAGARQNQEWAIAGSDCFALLFVKLGKKLDHLKLLGSFVRRRPFKHITCGEQTWPAETLFDGGSVYCVYLYARSRE